MLYATVRQRKIHVKNPVTVIRNGIGVDQVVLDMDDEWKDMTSIVCVFTNGSVAKEQLHTFGNVLEVPWECLTETGQLSLSCTGYVGSEKVMTTMLPDSFWNVVQNGPVTGDTPLEPTPTLYEQVLAAAGNANAVAQQLLQDKENGVFDGKPVEITHVDASEESGGENVVTFSDGNTLIVKNGKDGAQGLQGPRGADGTVSFENLTEEQKESLKGEKGDTGPAGADGAKGDKGDTGPQGPQGETGPQGPQGEQGATGLQGSAGRGVSSMTYSSSTNKWTITYTDGTTSSVTGPSIPDVSGYMPKSGGTFTGTAKAGSSYQAVGTSLLRNSKIVSTETYPTVNGEINWQYE